MTRPAHSQSAPEGRIVVATPLTHEAEDGVARVSWLRTVLRLAAEPEQHPWSSRWTLRHPGAIAALALALLLLLLFAASGCATVPLQSLPFAVSAPDAAQGLRCD